MVQDQFLHFLQVTNMKSDTINQISFQYYTTT